MATAYSILRQDEKGIDEAQIQSDNSQRSTTPRRALLPWFIHILIFLGYSTLYLLLSSNVDLATCTKKLSSWSPALSAVEYRTTYFQGSIGAANEFRGAPTTELESAWKHISMNAPGIRLQEADFVAMGKSLTDRDWYRIPEEYGGGYLGMTEVFHLLHCLDAIRRLTYPDHYPDLWAKRDTYQVRVHTDHCIDILRQRLMCTGDVGPVPFYRDTNPLNQFPLPDFSTRHQCRNFDKLLDWSHHNERALFWDQVGDLNLSHTD
jgi:hypothetical protein